MRQFQTKRFSLFSRVCFASDPAVGLRLLTLRLAYTDGLFLSHIGLDPEKLRSLFGARSFLHGFVRLVFRALAALAAAYAGHRVGYGGKGVQLVAVQWFGDGFAETSEESLLLPLDALHSEARERAGAGVGKPVAGGGFFFEKPLSLLFALLSHPFAGRGFSGHSKCGVPKDHGFAGFLFQ